MIGAGILVSIGKWFAGKGLDSLVEGYKAKLAAGNTSDRIAADLAGRELAVQQAEIEAQTKLRIAQLGYWYEPEKIMGYCVAFYFVKVVVWDVMLGLGTTDPIRGAVGEWMGLIVMFYFGKRGIENVARILKR